MQKHNSEHLTSMLSPLQDFFLSVKHFASMLVYIDEVHNTS